MPETTTATARRAITIRSILFSLLGIFLMSALAGQHDIVCRAGPLMIGNHLPGGALAYLVFVGLVWNGVAGRITKRLALSQKELVVVLCATLTACFPPTSGLFRYLLRIIVLPWYYLPGNPDWAEFGLLQSIDPKLFPSPDLSQGIPLPGTPEYAEYQRVYQGLFSGLAQGTQWVPIGELPLRAWVRPLLYWGPLVLLFSLLCIAMQFVVHRQWVQHEQLSYPLAQVTGRLCHRADGRPGVPDIFHDRLFWWGFVPVFAFYVFDLTAARYPTELPRMAEVFPSLRYWWIPIQEKFPAVYHTYGWWALTGQGLYFTIIGAAYFVATEISLTMGLNAILLTVFTLFYYLHFGTPVNGYQLDAGRAGSYLGYTLVLLYTGRTYFRAVFSRAFGGKQPLSGGDGTEVLAARVLVLAFLATVAVLRAMGLEWALSVLFTLVVAMLFLVFTRIICETGIPFLQTTWTPPGLLVSLLGPAAIGPKGLVMIHWLHVVVTQDPRECLMPYVATGVKVADDNGLKLRRVFAVIVVSVVLAVAVAFMASAYTQYNASVMTDGWASSPAVTTPFNTCARLLREVSDLGELEAAGRGSLLTRLPLIHATPSHVRFFLGGLAMVFLCSSLRFKFSRFPIHPVLFLVLGASPAMNTWGSFMVGWFVKSLVVRFGGGSVYQRLKPVFIGIIAGEVVFIGVHILFNLLYLHLFKVAPDFGVAPLPG